MNDWNMDHYPILGKSSLQLLLEEQLVLNENLMDKQQDLEHIDCKCGSVPYDAPFSPHGRPVSLFKC